LVKKLFVTDCEGPLTLNDNAYEISTKFIPEGNEFFRILSLFDDYFVDVLKKEDYKVGSTLKYIAPFFKAFGLNNEEFVKFSQENILFVNGAPDTLNLAKKAMDSFIISTSYGQYIEAISNTIDFPIENTYFTTLDLDSYEISDSEKEKLLKFKDIIMDIAKKESKTGVLDMDTLNEIFFEEIPKMNIFKLMDNINIVGGPGKQIALEDILSKFNADYNGVIYVGDSHTDIEPLRSTKENGGIAISFNGNEVTIKEAEIAIISDNTIATSLLIDLHSRFNKDYVLEFVKAYNINLKYAFENYRINFDLIDEFNNVFKDNQLPIIEIINKENIERISTLSLKMRKKIRGHEIGSLG